MFLQSEIPTKFYLSQMVPIIVVIIFVFLCMRSVWLLYFHPLSKIPGPVIAKITDGYSAFRSFRGDMHDHVKACHEKYGPVVRYGPNRILTQDPPDWDTIYGYAKPFKKSTGYATMVPWEGGWTTATVIDKTLHRQMRSTVRTSLSASALKDFEPVVFRVFERYLKKLCASPRTSTGWTEPLNMRESNPLWGLETMGEFGSGVQLGLLDRPDAHYVIEILHLHTVALGVFEQWPILKGLGFKHLFSWAMAGLFLFKMRFNNWYINFIQDALSRNQHKASGVFAHLIQAGVGEISIPGHNRSQMIADGSFMTFTSSDGLSATLSGIQHYLGHDERIYQKLQEEILSHFPHKERIEFGPELSACTYLSACINEVWRMIPPVLGVHWREAEVPVRIGGFPIPAGCDVGFSIYALFKRPDIFRDPHKFWPERWIPGVLPEEEFTFARKMFNPFLTGPRACLGRGTATLTTSVAVANFVKGYEWRLAKEKTCLCDMCTRKDENASSELMLETHFSMPMWREGPWIQLRERSWESSGT